MSEGEVRGLATPGSRVKVLWRHPEESEGAAGLGVRREPLGLCREGSHSSHLGGPLNNSDPPKTWRKIPCLRALHHYHSMCFYSYITQLWPLGSPAPWEGIPSFHHRVSLSHRPGPADFPSPDHQQCQLRK